MCYFSFLEFFCDIYKYVNQFINIKNEFININNEFVLLNYKN